MKKLLLFLIVVVALIYIFPIVYTFTSSFMTDRQLNTEGIQIIPQEFNLQQYYSISMYKSEYFRFFINSVKITSVIIVGQVVIGIIAAFAFAKLKFPGRDVIFIIYVLVILLPFQVTLVPNYLIFDKIERLLKIKIIDSHWALVLPGIFTSFGVFLLKQFIRSVPNELVEAARIDGAGNLKIFFTIVLPIIRPAVYSLIILTFIDNWNLLEQAIIFIDTAAKTPLSVFLETIYYQDFSVFYGGAVLYMVPAIMIFLKGEKYLHEGFSIGGLK